MGEDSKKKSPRVTKAPPPTSPVRGGLMGLDREASEIKTLPDWQFWLKMPNVALWQACALSLDIDPDSMKHSRDGWMAGGRGGPIFESGAFPSEAEKAEFYKRLRLLTANSHDPSHFSPGKLDMRESHLCEVRLPEFSAWAQSIGLEGIPTKLAEIARAPESIKPSQKNTIEKPMAEKESTDDNEIQELTLRAQIEYLLPEIERRLKRRY